MKIDLSSPAVAELIASFADTCRKFRAKIKLLESQNKKLSQELHLVKSATIQFMMDNHGMSYDDANSIIEGRMANLSPSTSTISPTFN